MTFAATGPGLCDWYAGFAGDAGRQATGRMPAVVYADALKLATATFTIDMAALPRGKFVSITTACTDSLGRSVVGTSPAFLVDESPPTADATLVTVALVSEAAGVETMLTTLPVVTDVCDVGPSTTLGWTVAPDVLALGDAMLQVSWQDVFRGGWPDRKLLAVSSNQSLFP